MNPINCLSLPKLTQAVDSLTPFDICFSLQDTFAVQRGDIAFRPNDFDVSFDPFTAFGSGNSKRRHGKGEVAGRGRRQGADSRRGGNCGRGGNEPCSCSAGPGRCIAEKGNRGAPGATGMQGPKGQRGHPGMEGLPGPKGDRGQPGLQGPTGLKGDRGKMGMPGFPGINGIPGAMGPPGFAGKNGMDGCNGTDVSYSYLSYALCVFYILIRACLGFQDLTALLE